MWQHYGKTFKRMQLLIAAVTLAVYLFPAHSLTQAATLFVIMQAGSIVGAYYAMRLKAAVERQETSLPLKPPI